MTSTNVSEAAAGVVQYPVCREYSNTYDDIKVTTYSNPVS